MDITENCVSCEELNGTIRPSAVADKKGNGYCNSHGRMSPESIAIEQLCGVAWSPRTIIMVSKMEDDKAA